MVAVIAYQMRHGSRPWSTRVLGVESVGATKEASVWSVIRPGIWCDLAVKYPFRKDLSYLSWEEGYARQMQRAKFVPAWIDALDLKLGDRVPEVGTGSGYASLTATNVRLPLGSRIIVFGYGMGVSS